LTDAPNHTIPPTDPDWLLSQLVLQFCCVAPHLWLEETLFCSDGTECIIFIVSPQYLKMFSQVGGYILFRENFLPDQNAF
jgi:hypothetical protein